MKLQDIYQIRNKMKKLHKKYNLLMKKQCSFGLILEEEIILKRIRIDLSTLREELIETHIILTLLPSLISKKSEKLISEIKEIVPWTGRLILRDEDFIPLSKVEEKLSREDREVIEQKLSIVHLSVMKSLQQFCSTENGWNYVYEISKIFNDDGDVIEVFNYIDTIYRDFGEILGFELQEIEFEIEDDE